MRVWVIPRACARFRAAESGRVQCRADAIARRWQWDDNRDRADAGGRTVEIGGGQKSAATCWTARISLRLENSGCLASSATARRCADVLGGIRRAVLSWCRCGAAGWGWVWLEGAVDRNSGVEGSLTPVMGWRAFVLGVAVAVMSVCASPAWGAFPGRDGDLVVATGGGLELVAPATAAARSICSSVVLCGHPAQPSFSPNGRAIAFVDRSSHRPVVVAADGSCLWCLLGAPLRTVTGSEPAFTPGGQGVTVAGN